MLYIPQHYLFLVDIINRKLYTNNINSRSTGSVICTVYHVTGNTNGYVRNAAFRVHVISIGEDEWEPINSNQFGSLYIQRKETYQFWCSIRIPTMQNSARCVNLELSSTMPNKTKPHIIQLNLT